MWLAERLRKTSLSGYEGSDFYNTDIVTAEAVEITDDNRELLSILAPAGIVRVPVNGEEQIVLECGDGSRVMLGTLSDDVPDDVLNGEIYAATSSASVHIKNDGSIELSGNVNITGTLTVNGTAVTL